jgi:hypothetical protein
MSNNTKACLTSICDRASKTSEYLFSSFSAKDDTSSYRRRESGMSAGICETRRAPQCW